MQNIGLQLVGNLSVINQFTNNYLNMKITKRILPTVLMLALGCFALQAQRTNERPSMEPEKMAEKQTARMTEELSLDVQQAEKVNAINLKYAQQQKGKMEQAKTERENRRADLQKTHDAKMAELKQVLTPEQYAQLEKQQAERVEKVRAHRKDHPRGAAGRNKDATPEERAEKMTHKMVEKLSLNEKQAKSLEKVNLDFAKKREAMFNDNKAERQKNKEAMKKLNDEQKAAIGKILTPEQMKKWEELKEERGDRSPRKGRGTNDGRM